MSADDSARRVEATIGDFAANCGVQKDRFLLEISGGELTRSSMDAIGSILNEVRVAAVNHLVATRGRGNTMVFVEQSFVIPIAHSGRISDSSAPFVNKLLQTLLCNIATEAVITLSPPESGASSEPQSTGTVAEGFRGRVEGVTPLTDIETRLSSD